MKKLYLIEIPDHLTMIDIRGADSHVPANHIKLEVKEITFPKDEDVNKEINIRFTDEYTRQEVYKLIDKYRRQTMGELIGHNKNITK